MTEPTKRRRRAPGEGSITRRQDGLWAGMLDLGWQDGKRRRKFVYARTRAEAARKLADANRQLEEGRLIADERTTVEQYLRSWLENIEPTIAASTHKRYGQLLRLHAYPFIGRHRLRKLEPTHLARLYARRVKAGLSPTTVLQLHRVLHHALKDAHRQGLAPRNVTELVTPPVKAEHEFITLSPKQARRFLEVVAGNRLEALYVVALTTGMREGELLGLRWADVDLDSGAFHVVRRLRRGAQASPRAPGGGTLAGRLDLGRERAGVPEHHRPTDQPVELPPARVLPAPAEGRFAPDALP